MSTKLEWILVGWSLLAAMWWIIATGLVWRQRAVRPMKRRMAASTSSVEARTLSIFKPIAALREEIPPLELVAALESFVSQLDAKTEMLLGIEEKDGRAWESVVEKWRMRFPGVQLKPVVCPRPSRFLSPKVSWFHILAEHASGELWMWSDSDIVASAGLIDTMRGELADGQAGLVTCPYVVRRIDNGPMILEALFANLEFYPGVLLCRRTGPVRFAFGAAMMFSAEWFRERVDWEKLGARMADDNALGRALAPVRISEATVETFASESNWRDAMQHYLRWQKTVRWCQPAGFAGQIVILPVLGWLLAALTHPSSVTAWLGLALTVQIEMLAAVTVFGLIGSELRSWWAIGLWSSLLRPLVWVACWTPWPVVFRSQNRKWFSLYQSIPLEGET